MTSFGITSAGIRFDPLITPNRPLRATLRAATVGMPYPTRGAILATAMINFVDTGLGFYDIPLDFALIGGNTYDIAFDIVGGGGWFFNQYNMEFYLFDAVNEFPYNVGGQVRVLDGGGFLGDCAGSNYATNVMPHVRLNGTAVAVVPEPGTYALVAAGLAAVAFVRCRRRNV